MGCPLVFVKWWVNILWTYELMLKGWTIQLKTNQDIIVDTLRALV